MTWPCSECDRTFATAHALSNHWMRHHALAELWHGHLLHDAWTWWPTRLLVILGGAALFLMTFSFLTALRHLLG